MRVVTPAEIDRALAFPVLIGALEEAFRAEVSVPPRPHVAIPRPGAEATLLLMPAWTGEGLEPFIGIKAIAIFPANLAKGRAPASTWTRGTPWRRRATSSAPCSAA